VDPLVNPAADTENMSEDCLYLNVYTPAGASSLKNPDVPVLVWLHGGAFQQGGANRPEYDGRRLAERGTVVVTINYRLGALGFLVSSSDGVFGNFGLMDQRAALVWVQQNIRYFGGNPDNVCLFGESAGGVMTGLHLLMEHGSTSQLRTTDTTHDQSTATSYNKNNNMKRQQNNRRRLFHKAIIQSNPLGLQFRSIVVADFIGEALKRSVDCRDLACMRAERVEEILRAQSTLMGIPRSVGDFFTWGPTLTSEHHLSLQQHYERKKSPFPKEHAMFRDLDFYRWTNANRDNFWAAVNVTQPLKNLHLIPDDIPIIIGANKHEGEMFVHGAFPITMSRPVYWMFVGALFRDSASRVLKHYRGYVDKIEQEAQELARKQIEEEENRQFYLENQDELDREYQMLLRLNATVTDPDPPLTGYEALVETWSRGGATTTRQIANNTAWHHRLWPFRNSKEATPAQKEKREAREERKRIRAKERALKQAAKVVVDYRPVMSRIIDDYLFRCPAWHFAHKLSRNRLERGKTNNVFVYQFSHSTHIPGYEECWGKSCHTAELPFVFQAMDIIRTNYSTLSPVAQNEAPASPEYPYTDILAAYRDAMDAADRNSDNDETVPSTAHGHIYSSGSNTNSTSHHTRGFQHILAHFFGDYFKEDADEEIASDMADRWVAFAKTGDPNYDSSKARWRPWRYVFDGELEEETIRPWEPEDFDEIFDLNRIDAEQSYGNAINNTVIEGHYWSEDSDERMYRRRALIALGMEVIEEDVFQTMLRRIKFVEEADNPFHNFLLRIARNQAKGGRKGGKEKHLRRAVRQLQRIAQDMGFIGTGLQGEPRRSNAPVSDYWEDAFFPEILELKWPPEGRLVERDCTCDMWDRIRYRY
jgi:carboxylesterase type B